MSGLTLAVGLGIAVSSGQGVANAETDSTDTGSPGSTASSRSSDTESSTPPDASPGDEQKRSVTSRLRTRDATESTETTRPSPRDLSPRRLKLREDIRLALTRATAATDAEPTQPADSGSGTTTPGGDTGSPASPAPEPDLEIPDAEPNTAPIDTSAPSPDPATVMELALGDRTAVTASTLATRRADLARMRGTDPGSAARVLSERFSALTVNTVAPAVYSAVPQATAQTQTTSDPITVTSSPKLSPIAAVIAVPARIVSGLLALVGLGPTAAPGAPASPITKLVELAWVALRRVNSFFFNSTPTATVTLVDPSVTGVVTGQVVGHDKDGDRLEYRVVEDPTNGTVELHADGSFTYTATVRPDGTLGGPDTFRVAVVDKGFHLHGLLGFLKPFGGHATVVRVDLDATPVNEAPVIELIGTHVPANGGVITGTVRITDDGATLPTVTVTQPDPQLGTVTIDHVDGDTWQWKLTPDPALPASETAVSFAITADDGRATTTLPVEVTIPAPTPIVVDIQIIYLPSIVVTPPAPPATIELPEGQLLVTLNTGSLYIPGPSTSQTIDLTSGSLVYPPPAGSSDLLVLNPDLTISTGAIVGSQLQLTGTGITLNETPTSLTLVGGNLTTGGALVTTSGSQLTVQGMNDFPVIVNGVEVFTADAAFKEVVVVGSTNTVAATSPYAMSFLQVGFNLGSRAALSDAPSSRISVEVIEVVDFDGGLVGKLATHGNSTFVTVTYDGITYLKKYDDTWYSTELELPGAVSSIAISEDGTRGYLVDDAAGTVTVIEIMEHYYGMNVIDTIHTGPGHVSALSNGRFAVTNPTTGTVTIVQLD
ncbi:Ig-like domain-containing protein [Mycobacterium sp. ACS4331]|uniref:Ig-like domain-containing protein n=1 Tax=Mycobacterium sp. ACS4331 TaxID=1834121 RepID=UPI0018D47490|nr:Ig-like domain-containing protein [Mycobacterium sp. ACS4331]